MNVNGILIDKILAAAVPEIAYEHRQANRATVGHLTGEDRLMLRVLEDAVDVIHGAVTAGTYSYKHKEEPRLEAIEWFESDDEDWIFSFVSICERFGLDPQAVRAAVLGKKKRAA